MCTGLDLYNWFIQQGRQQVGIHQAQFRIFGAERSERTAIEDHPGSICVGFPASLVIKQVEPVNRLHKSPAKWTVWFELTW